MNDPKTMTRRTLMLAACLALTACGGGDNDAPNVPPTGEPGGGNAGALVQSVSAQMDHALALRSDGAVFAWGRNEDGQLGDGSNADRSTPVRLTSLSAAKAIASGITASYVVAADGTVWAFGQNDRHQLGDGSVASHAAPVQVPGLSGIESVRVRERSVFALAADGTVYAWGQNDHGQLGIGNTNDVGTPVVVAALAGVKDVQAGASHTLALRHDGTVLSWGQSLAKQLGELPDATDRLLPVAVAGLNGIVAIAAGDLHALALRSDGQVMVWGNNEYRQLGLGASRASQSAPVLLPGLSGVAQIVAGAINGMAITGSGAVFAWGDNDAGQLGDGSTQARVTPVAVPALAGATSLGLGFSHSVWVRPDGTAWALGENTHGSLGDGSVGNRLLPAKVIALDDGNP